MSKKPIYLMVLVIFLMGVLGVSINVHKVEATSGTIYIKANGLVEGTDKISNENNVTYTFTDHINDSIVVERSNIVIDGDGWTLDGLDFTIWEALNLTGVSNVTIIDINIQRFLSYSIYLKSASQCVISRNTVTGSEGGIGLFSSTGNRVSDNEITGCWEAVELVHSSGNVVSGNNITDNSSGVYLFNSTDNTIAGNSMTANNFAGVSFTSSSNFNTISGNNITNNRRGIRLISSSNSNTISGNNITDNEYHGISIVDYSHNNTISRNILVNNTNGIDIVGVLFTTISRNHITENNQYGITLDNASNNTISANNITNNNLGIFYDGLCNNNTAYHNNFIDNANHVEVSPGDVDAWDDGFEGNYWSDFPGVDVDGGGDGISDNPYIINSLNRDNHPLMGPVSFFDAGTWNEKTYYVHTVTNSTMSDFNFSQSNKVVSFNVTGPNGAVGFCRVAIPRELLWCEDIFDWTVRVNGTVVPIRIQEYANYTYLYFTYSHSVQNVKIYGTHVIPEFPSFLILPIFMIATLVAVIAYKRKRPGEG